MMSVETGNNKKAFREEGFFVVGVVESPTLSKDDSRILANLSADGA